MVVTELQRIQAESAKAPQAIYEAEKKLAQCEFDFERGKALAFMNAQGTVADRENLAKYESAELRLAADVAKAELNRVRAKAKQLSEAGMLMATISKTVELAMRA